jgi:hypothetical protein
MADHGYRNIEDEQINYALSSKHAEGDTEKAFEMVLLFQESVDGVVKPYDPTVLMLGAENREGVTCYLDALLYASSLCCTQNSKTSLDGDSQLLLGYG